jgi:hypothetical protein
MISSGNLSYAKRTLVGWMSGNWTQKGRNRFGCRPLRLEGNHFGWRSPWLGVGGPCPFSIIYWHLPYTWGNAHKTQSRLPKKTFCPPQATLNRRHMRKRF